MSLRRSLLLPVFLLGFLHAYIGWRILPDLPVDLALRIVGVVLLLLSYALMLFGLMARSIPPRPLSDRISAAALFTAGFFSSLLVFTLLRDVVLLVAWLRSSNPAARSSRVAAGRALLMRTRLPVPVIDPLAITRDEVLVPVVEMVKPLPFKVIVPLK